MDWSKYDAHDLLKLLIFGESEGEGVIGQMAVGQVVRNQLNDERQRFGKEWKEVMLHPLRYSCFNEGSPRIEPMIRLIKEQQPKYLYRQISWLITGIVGGLIAEDITKGSNHYITRELYVSEDCPAWAKRCSVMTRIGDHIFLRE